MSIRGLLRTRANGVALILILAVGWEYLADEMQSPNWPPISDIVISLVAGLASGELTAPFQSTLRTMVVGFFAGSIAAIALGLLMAVSRLFNASLDLIVELLRPIPIPAIVPPLILIFGIDAALKIFVVAFSVFFPVLINTIAGVRAVDPVAIDVGRNLRVGRARMLTQILFPAALPYILAGMRTGLSLSLLIAVTAEMIAGSAGVGYYLVATQYAMRAPDMYAAVLLLAVAGYTLNRLFVLLEGKALHWYKVRNG